MQDRDTGQNLVVTDILLPGEYTVLARGFNAIINCKKCGKKCHLGNYVIQQNCVVTPTFTCPNCHWQGNLLLEGYQAPADLPEVATC
ncbi:MAG: hypothetical protein FVQ79_00205 [Planctomycetes bacterium]|nr:hypothetical protein [Planctomycetota bacterium]